MTDIRWKRIESLFHEALPLQGEERERFLARLREDDPSLHEELAALLLSFREQDEVFENMAVSSVLQETEPETLSPGEPVGPYKIIRLLGRGGMGEVYLASDPRLRRQVALKILPRALAGAPELVERLQREAQAASALNHPNILTIYDFGTHHGFPYIVSEFIEGESLREKIGHLKIHEAIEYARQIGRALQAAHAAGIVHRDIKPENIMVRSDGYIKVLDFGLAKLSSLQLPGGKTLAEQLRETGLHTIPGLLLGTIGYMSPEQVRGQPADFRSDQWSWGVVLYEMLAGKRPFDDATPGDVLASILGRAPDPPTSLHELNGIVARALEKRSEDRYNNMAEALEDIERIRLQANSRRKWSFWRRPKHSLFNRHSSRVWLVLGSLLALVVASTFSYLLWQPQERWVIDKQLTQNGNVTFATISSDGSYLAYVTAENEGQTLRVMDIVAKADKERLARSADHYSGVTFSPDGKFIYYVRGQESFNRLYRISTFPGIEPKMLLENVDSPISFSPDGSSFAFERTDDKTNQSFLLIAEAANPEKLETLITLNPPEVLKTSAPLWTPDGNSLVCLVYAPNDGQRPWRLVSIPRSGGKRHDILPANWNYAYQPAWINRGRSLAVAVSSPQSSTDQLMEIRWPSGDISPLYQSTENHLDGASTTDFRKLAVIQSRRLSSIWIVPLDSNKASYSVTDAGERFYGITWANHDQLVSERLFQGQLDLWLIDPATRRMLYHLTNDPFVEQYPSVSRDGKYLVFASNRGDNWHVWIMGSHGELPKRLTNDDDQEDEGIVSPNSTEILFTSHRSGQQSLWRMAVERGIPQHIGPKNASNPSFSPDGKSFICEYFDDATQKWQVGLFQYPEGVFLRAYPSISLRELVHPHPRFSVNGKDILYVKTSPDGISNIWSQSRHGGVPHQLTYFSESRIFAIAPSPDGKSIACIRGNDITDVYLMRAAK